MYDYTSRKDAEHETRVYDARKAAQEKSKRDLHRKNLLIDIERFESNISELTHKIGAIDIEERELDAIIRRGKRVNVRATHQKKDTEGRTLSAMRASLRDLEMKERELRNDITERERQLRETQNESTEAEDAENKRRSAEKRLDERLSEKDTLSKEIADLRGEVDRLRRELTTLP